MSTLPYTLHLGDSREVLKTLPDNSVDSIVTDPPYGLSKEPDMAEVLQHWIAGDDYTATGGGFMGKTWDGFVPGPAVWRECMRVLKPGGHLLAFFGSRTYDMGTLAIRLAGFEIRDRILYLRGDGEAEEHFPVWIYASGFPKSNNLDRLRGNKICGCPVQYSHEIQSQNLRGVRDIMDAQGPIPSRQEPNVLEGLQKNTAEKNSRSETETDLGTFRQVNVDLPGVRDEILAEHKMARKSGESDVQPPMQRETARAGMGEARAQRSCCVDGKEPCELCCEDVWKSEPCLERRGDDALSKGQLCASEVRSSASVGDSDGTQGRLCDGASPNHGGMVRISADADRSCPPRRPHAAEQCERQSGALAGQSKSQTMGAWPVCGGCGLPMVPKGLGTALKPAHEPIVVARKPLIGTVAANVLKHGTGALNIDGCRVATDPAVDDPRLGGAGVWNTDKAAKNVYEGGYAGDVVASSPLGRWPANVIHDGSEEVVAQFPAQAGAAAPVHRRNADKFRNAYGAFPGNIDEAGSTFHGDTGSAARFFYCAKASKKDRGEGNTHPTVKPTDLMAYLVRLVTPPGGLVLDPFMGSGSTGKACMREGFRFIGIDLTPEYVDTARARIEHEHSKTTQDTEQSKQVSLF